MYTNDALDSLSDAELSERVAVECAGWIGWLEERGGYTHFIWQRPGDREPWKGSRDSEEIKKRYRLAAPQAPDRKKHVLHTEPPFATDANAVLALAPIGLRIKRTATGWNTDLCTDFGCSMGDDEVLARAVSKVLLRSARAQKGTP